MTAYIWTALTGWLAAILFVSGLSIPYLLRANPGSSRPFLKRLWPHYWIGYGLPVIAFYHAWLPMSRGMQRLNQTGIWLATLALILLIVQLFIGITLRGPLREGGRRLRGIHFGTMALLAGLILVHIALNRP